MRLFTRRIFNSGLLASLLALIGIKRTEASPKPIPKPPSDAQEADCPHDMFARFRIKSCGIMLGDTDTGILAEGVTFDKSTPYYGTTGGTGSIDRLVGPSTLVDEFCKRFSSVIQPEDLHLRLFRPGKIDLVLEKVVLTSIGTQIAAQNMTIIGNAGQVPAIQFMGISLLKMDVPASNFETVRAVVIPKDNCVRFDNEVVVESPDLVIQFATSPAKRG